MFELKNDAMLIDDREDLIAVLRMRFGDIPGDMIQHIYDISEYSTLQALILAAANAPSWNTFLEEFKMGNETFRLVGENFNPLANDQKGWESLNETKEK
jgi:hypothetical protein